jgi:hypothetical protein
MKKAVNFHFPESGKFWFKIDYSDFLEFSKNSHQTVPNSTEQYQFLENYHFSNTVLNTVFIKILNMFDRIKLIKHYIFYIKLKFFVLCFFTSMQTSNFLIKLNFFSKFDSLMRRIFKFLAQKILNYAKLSKMKNTVFDTGVRTT